MGRSICAPRHILRHAVDTVGPRTGSAVDLADLTADGFDAVVVLARGVDERTGSEDHAGARGVIEECTAAFHSVRDCFCG